MPTPAWTGNHHGVVRMDEHVMITETRHGFICANAGVDRSNVSGKDWVSLLPVAPDDSALLLKTRLAELLRVNVGVIITDTFGRAWREGLTNVAIGVAGFVATVWYLRRRNARSAGMADATDTPRSLREAKGELDEIERFEKM